MTLNEEIKIYRKANTRAADGGLSQTRTLIKTVRAMVRPLSGSERSKSEAREAYANYRFDVLYDSSFKEGDIIVWKSTDYNIMFIGEAGPKPRYMYIDAERGGAM